MEQVNDLSLDAFALRAALAEGKLVVANCDKRCTIKLEVAPQGGGSVYTMNGPTGRHAITADSDVSRLWKHWMGYKLNNINNEGK